MNKSSSRIPLIYVIAIISMLLLVSLSSYLASKNTEEKMNSVVSRIMPLFTLSEEILINLLDMETGVRSYENTQDTKYLEPYESAKASLRANLNSMTAYEEEYPQIYKIMEMDVLPQIQRLQTYYFVQVSLIADGKKDEALQRFVTGKTQMDKFRDLHTKLSAEIGVVATEAYSSARDAERTARVIIMAGGGIAILVGLYSAFIFHRANRAETALRKSEETYRYMAESLEVQNEEIIAQQEEQEATLEKLSQREQELEAINTYQEKLTGAMDMEGFLQHSVPALLDTLKLDACMIVMKTASENSGEAVYEVLHASGYPAHQSRLSESQLYGTALRVLKEKVPLECTRQVSEQERGFHQGIAYALDCYYPLFDDNQETIGFLLLTGYQHTQDEQKARLSKGLVRQFGLAFLAQQFNEDRRRQAACLKQLNVELMEEKVRIEEQRDLIHNILESTHEGMMMMDTRGTILFANSRMNLSDSHIGLNIAEVYGPVAALSSQLTELYAMIEGLLRGETDQLNERFISPGINGRPQRYFELYATKVGDQHNDTIQGYLLIFRDRTEEAKVDEMKNEFISIVSHELRTPLASVLGFIEILLHRKLPAEKQQRYMQTIYKEANRLSTLINDFLDLQRMEAGKQSYHFAPLEFSRLVQEVGEQWSDKHGHSIIMDVPQKELWIRGDADRLKQVVHNLLSNAVKYSPGSDRVDLKLLQEGRSVKLLVQDYGLGIPHDAKDKMFSKFYRVDNSDRRQIGGTGLGLSIVREIVEAHDGTVTFESEMGEGTTFTVQLEAFHMTPVDGSLLILEDDDNLAKLITETLGTLNCPILHVHSAEEGISALQRAKESGPLLCVVDIQLQGARNGWDFLGELYRHPKYHRTPVIVSTALEPPVDYYEKNTEKFLRKPFSMEKLLQAAIHLLEHSGGSPAYIFPIQNEKLITSKLAQNGIEVGEIRRENDLIQIEPRVAQPTESGKGGSSS